MAAGLNRVTACEVRVAMKSTDRGYTMIAGWPNKSVVGLIKNSETITAVRLQVVYINPWKRHGFFQVVFKLTAFPITSYIWQNDIWSCECRKHSPADNEVAS